MLENLPQTETFNTHADNALADGEVTVTNGAFAVTMPAYSMMAIEVPGISSGVDNFAAEAVAVYPNPTTDVLYVTNNGDVRLVEIVNSNGQVVKRVSASGAEDVVIPVADLAKAVYVVKIHTPTGIKVSTAVVR